MLPDFPELKSEVQEHLMKMLADRARRMTGVLQMVRQTVHHEGRSWTLQRPEGEPETSEYARLGGEIRLEPSAIPYMTSVQVGRLLAELVTDMARQQSRLFFDTIEQAVEKVGNTVDAGGAPLSPEIYLGLYEKIEIGFEKDGRPRLPTLVASPELCDQWAIKFEQWLKDPSFRKKMDEIIERKRESWRVREASRRLVD